MIPLIDWSENAADPAGFAKRVGTACRDTGFFVLQNHTVPDALRAQVFAQADAFFALPQQDKARVSILNTPHFRGWAKPGDESLDETTAQVDTKETFNIGLDLPTDDPRVVAGEPFRGVNQWPDLPGFAETMRAYYDAAQNLGISLLRVIARDLGLASDHFTPSFHDPLSALRLLSYPPGTGADNEIGAGAHTDYGAITLLMTDGEPGLQVRPRGGDWIDVPHVPDAYVVNIGDCMMRWTNDIYVSTPHRVIPPKRRRRSVAMFIEANPDTVVQALPGTGTPKYAPIRAADYLMSRLDATYAPKDLQ
ncbi:2-oxoglutarate and iron-dependent oxygenase domain-containing protein [uncultured Tateyamaria sp.]|uniref:isopenicillin N synthase family dioxygenase n=1 Tax=uncultured Tateyamaria sp. TaxID=455651 RepID=UPI0026079D5A|nr:2-oxoglutarate and iron-dependent oxygenase domain-containing protein [uncultured Tateyamaria sp.]